MTYRLLLGMLGICLLVGLSARADTVIIRNREKAIEGTVKSEDAKSVVIVHVVDKKKVEEAIPALVTRIDVLKGETSTKWTNLSCGLTIPQKLCGFTRMII